MMNGAKTNGITTQRYKMSVRSSNMNWTETSYF